MRAVEAPRIEAFNGNDGCRRDASFIRDLHRRGLLFRRVAFVTGCTPYRREHQLKGGTSVLARFSFFFFLISHHSLTTIWSIREKTRVSFEFQSSLSKHTFELVKNFHRLKHAYTWPFFSSFYYLLPL